MSFKSLFVSRLGAALCVLVWFSPNALSQVRINEFLAKNEIGIQDEDGDRSDWIELFNESAQPVDLIGWSLSDDSSDLDQWSFPAVILGAGQYLIVHASNKDRATVGLPLHTNFKLSTGGEFLGLTRPDGTPATRFDPAFPLQSPDVSYGLLLDGVTEAFFDPPTPGAVNSQGTLLLPPISVSHERGLYTDDFDAVLQHATQSAEIHYTLDGSEPTMLSPVYGTPLMIRQTTILRMRAFSAGYGPSVVQTVSYILPADVAQQD
ncbi:MAG: lamin tail domain-containing protein, partial [Planctomycetes bacterium]|nr:lamin tail domain-containing protein [Planctomycetota bacterium]